MDKSLLEYHGRPQVEYCFDLLLLLCDRVFLSTRKDQADQEEYKEIPQIHDLVRDMGPLGGILSALAQYPHTVWLVLACDLPFVNEHVLKNLIANRDPLKMATAYKSVPGGFPEPLCAIYEPHSLSRLLEFLTAGEICPRKILINSNARLIDLQEGNCLANVNTPEEYAQVARALNK